MNARDNGVFRAVLQILGMESKVWPENVLVGYAKLLDMNENVRNIAFKNMDLNDINAARLWFSSKKINIKQIKLYLPRILNVREPYEVHEDFEKLLKVKYSSKDILTVALEYSVVPIYSLFSGKNDEYLIQFIELKKKSDNKSKPISVEDNESEQLTAQEKGPKSEEKSESNTKNIEKNIPNNEGVMEFEKLSYKYSELILKLLEKIKGQDRAIIKFIQGFNQGELFHNSEKRNRPRSYHFFFGPPGVGKTFLAETAAEILGMPYKVFNMSEYASNLDNEKLVGFDPGYKGAKDGELTSFVEKNKRCFLIFDEIEKAHINTIRLFLQILGSGSLDSVYTKKTVDFRDTVIVFTSNVGRALYEDSNVVLSEIPEKVLIDAVKSGKKLGTDTAIMPPEICSRIASGNVVVFNHLSVKDLLDIIDEKYKMCVEYMNQEFGIKVIYPEELPMLFLLSRGSSIDARIATNKGEDFLKDEIFEFIRQYIKDQAQADINELAISINWDNIDKELKKLFKPNQKQGVLIFADKKLGLKSFIDSKKYDVYYASTFEEAENVLANDIAAVLIDPFWPPEDSNDVVLSVSDYNTQGVKFFHDLRFKGINIPVFMLETSKDFMDVDKKTFMLEGAQGTIPCAKENLLGRKNSSFSRYFEETMTALYMESAVKNFTQRGWVVSFNTSQNILDNKGTYSIEFYDLKKRMAVDMDGRDSVLSETERPRVKFNDIIGAEDAKNELMYFVEYLKNPRAYASKKGTKRLPKGVLLYGPPGTGKTMLAKAMAGESDIMFLQTTAAAFKNRFVGESEANIRRLFAKARKYAPAIVFIDEIDAIGKQRTGNDSSTESMLNTLLTEMDGFSSNSLDKPVFVLAATNFGAGRTETGMPSLDGALMRRFDNKIYVDLPNEEERAKFIKTLLASKAEHNISEATIQNLAERTTGTSLAILQNVIELAEREADRQGHGLADADLFEALEDYLYGQKNEHSYDYYREIAYHEVGHAYLSYISGDKPSYITIESRGNFGGYMQHANQEEKPNYTKDELLANIRTCMGGRAAEKVFFGEGKSLNTGASSDLKNATDMAFQIICGLGMDEDSLVVLNREEVMHSPLATEYLQKVNAILKVEMQEAVEIISNNKEIIESIVKELLKKNYLTGAEFDNLIQNWQTAASDN